MNRRPHPLFSRIGCLAALLVALALAALIYTRGGAPFSPGPLSAEETGIASSTRSEFKNHAQFEEDCAQCHEPWRGVSAERCQACHTGVADQRRTGRGLHGLFDDTGRCEACHTEHEGREATLTTVPVDLFDHDRTAFTLLHHRTGYDGQPLPCSDCHTDGRLSAATVNCQDCHAAADPVFMARHRLGFGADCLACRDGQDRMRQFDHGDVFMLQGAHTTLACSACHGVETFDDAPRDCVGCHAEPAVHAGLFGLDCAGCHTPDAWRPAHFPAHTFPLDHGGEGIIACTVCHGEQFNTYTCYNCHEHEPGDIREEHVDEGIFEFQNCVACHPTGTEDEAEALFDD